MRVVPTIPGYRDEFNKMLGFAWFNIGGYANVWQYGPLRVIVSMNVEGWNHISVSLENRIPSWNEMEFVKRAFFEPWETVMQLHVPEAEHVNFNPHVLHLWQPCGQMIPRPPNHLVGAPA